MLYYILIAYIIGAVITGGYVGGVRDEMGGIGDLFCILFWFIYLPVKMLFWFLGWCYDVGALFKGDK